MANKLNYCNEKFTSARGSGVCMCGALEITRLRAAKRFFSSERAWNSDENRISMAHTTTPLRRMDFQLQIVIFNRKYRSPRGELGFRVSSFQTILVCGFPVRVCATARNRLKAASRSPYLMKLIARSHRFSHKTLDGLIERKHFHRPRAIDTISTPTCDVSGITRRMLKSL